MKHRLTRTLVAGAAGTLALEATTYLDVALRGRPPSEVPARVVGKLAQDAGIESIAESHNDETSKNRRTGVSALLGYATGIGAATFGAMLMPRRRSLLTLAILTGGAAMAASDISSTRLGVTDPKTWTAADWLADAIPHAVFGLVTAMVLHEK